MTKVYVRAIVPTENSYLLMGDRDKNGEEIWDLPGGELKPGIDVKQCLRQLVLQNTGYAIKDIRFFEIACRIKPRKRGQDPATTLDFVFTSKVEAADLQTPLKQIELLRFEKFEWIKSGGVFRANKVMGLLAQFHGQQVRNEEARLQVEIEDEE